MHQNYKELLIIDDDSCHNIVCALALKRFLRSSDVSMIGFTDSEEGLAHIMRMAEGVPKKTLLFLDINMPRMNGWEILHRLEQLPVAIKKYLDVYLITSSPNQQDAQRVSRNSMVKQYLEKPLSNHLQLLFSKTPVIQKPAFELSAA